MMQISVNEALNSSFAQVSLPVFIKSDLEVGAWVIDRELNSQELGKSRCSSPFYLFFYVVTKAFALIFWLISHRRGLNEAKVHTFRQMKF